MAHKILKKETHEKEELMKKDELAITVDTPQPDPLRLSIGTVRQGPIASVTNSGSDQNVILDFVLPSQVTAVPNDYPMGVKWVSIREGKLYHENKSVYNLSPSSSTDGPTHFYGIDGGKAGDIIHIILSSNYLLKEKPGSGYSLNLQDGLEINTNNFHSGTVFNKVMTFLCLAPNTWVEIQRNWTDLVTPFVKVTTEEEYNSIPYKDPEKIYLIVGE